MNSLAATLQYFVVITIELLALFMLINAAVELVMMYVSQETIRAKLSGKGLAGNALGALFGAVTPFCACSTIPVTVGLLNAGVPFGSTMSFLIASPLLNPIIFGMLATLISFRAALIYFALAFAASVVFGFALEGIGGARYVKRVRVTTNGAQAIADRRTLPFRGKLTQAFTAAWSNLRPMLGYLLIGVAVGAAIYGYLPSDVLVDIAGADNLFAVPVAAVVGIPLYIRAETAIPIGVALMGKGVSIGAVVALVIGGAGMAIPEMAMLAAIFRKPLVAMIVATIFLTATISGYVFNVVM